MSDAAYFPDDEPRLKALLDSFLASLAEDLSVQPFRSEIRALLLAGGYGRGEGGIFRENSDALGKLYNDLEFYLVTTDSAELSAMEKWCAAQAHRGDEQLGIEVEFKILRERALRDAGPSMFYYDLLAAHRLVFGSDDFATSLPPRLRDPALIPAHEATRLLFNRGTGLFFCRVALSRGDDRVGNGFIERNHAKVRLALADSVLALNGRYDFSCRTRHDRLGESLKITPSFWQKLVEWHREGVEFKLHPRHRHPSPDDLVRQQEEIAAVWLDTWLWIESHRLLHQFVDAETYADFRGRLYPQTNPLRNCALHLRDRIKRHSALPVWVDYPRAALQRALAVLVKKNARHDRAARCLGLPAAASLDAIHDRYEFWWRLYN